MNYDVAAVVERYELQPEQIADFKGLKGDTSDNIPGVPGIGDKTATKLLQEFGTVEAIYERIEDVTPEKLRENLRVHEKRGAPEQGPGDDRAQRAGDARPRRVPAAQLRPRADREAVPSSSSFGR